MDLELIKDSSSCDPQNEEKPVNSTPKGSIFKRDTIKSRSRDGLKTSKVYDVLNDPVLDKILEEYEALAEDQKRIYNLILDKKIRKNNRKKKFNAPKVTLDFAIKSKNINSFEFQAYLEDVTKKLELEGLWSENLTEKCESELFSIADLKDDDLDGNFNPKELHIIFNPKNMSSHKDSLSELNEEGIEWADTATFNIEDLPQFTTPTIHNLLRRSPWNIFEAMARKMIEGSFFKENPELEKLWPCAYFLSKSILERKLFIKVKYEAFAATPLQKIFRAYPYRRYLQDQKALLKVINELLKKYFQFNSSLNQGLEKSNLSSLWKRFLAVYKSLTKKQMEALELKYTSEPVLTYEEAALKLGISKDSFQDRVRGAIKKIRNALPELNDIDYEKKNLSDEYSKTKRANKIEPLYRVDMKSGARIEIPRRTNKPNLRKDGPSKEIVRAWSIGSTPVPDIIFTDFYLGLVPEAYIARKSGQSKFRG